MPRTALITGASSGLGAEYARQLAARGVTVVEGPGAAVAAVAADLVQLADGSVLPSEVTVWTAGFGVPRLAATSGMTTDASGRLLACAADTSSATGVGHLSSIAVVPEARGQGLGVGRGAGLAEGDDRGLDVVRDAVIAARWRAARPAAGGRPRSVRRRWAARCRDRSRRPPH